MDYDVIYQLSQRYINTHNEGDHELFWKKLDTILEELKQYLETCRKIEPTNVDLLLRLAIVYDFFHEEDIGVAYLDTIPLAHPLYPKSLLIRTFIQAGLSPIDKAAYNALITASRSNSDPEMKSMLLFAAAYYWDLQPDEYKKLLLESVKLWSLHTRNITWLAGIYFREGHKTQGYKLIIQALRNIKEMSDRYITGDVTDPDEFIDTHIKGIYLNTVLFGSLIDNIDTIAEELDIAENQHATYEESH